MKLRNKFILFVVLFNLTAVVLSYFIFRENKLYFILFEVLIIFSIIVSWLFYQQLIQPLRLLSEAAEAIKDKNFNTKFVSSGHYEMDQLIAVYNQMAGELRNERARQEQQHHFLEKLIETSPTAILILDYDQKIMAINPAGAKILNLSREEALLMSILHSTHPLLSQIEHINSGSSATIKLNGVNTFKIRKAHFIDRGFTRHFVMIEELTAELMAVEKKAYGKVIRMMAHEVNNTIGPVNSIIQTALTIDGLWENADTHALKNALRIAHDRNGNLTAFMRNFSEVVRLPEPHKRPFDLHQLMRSLAVFLSPLMAARNIRLNFQFADAPFIIEADEQQMEQALINVLKNAAEAIEQDGEIVFTSAAANGWICITDTGKGIDEQHREELFTPFFSTKKDGQGIGLTLVKEILLKHGFDFSLRTISPGCTRFTLHTGK